MNTRTAPLIERSPAVQTILFMGHMRYVPNVDVEATYDWENILSEFEQAMLFEVI